MLTNINKVLDKPSKKLFLYLVLFSIVISIIEAVGVSAIMPFIDIATNLQAVQENYYYRYVFNLFSFEREIDFAMYFGLFLLIFYAFRGVINYFYSYKMTQFSQEMYSKVILTKEPYLNYSEGDC